MKNVAQGVEATSSVALRRRDSGRPGPWVRPIK
jgi:hypothetical protein